MCDEHAIKCFMQINFCPVGRSAITIYHESFLVENFDYKCSRKKVLKT